MPIDYANYPPNWKTEIRPAVLKRAKDCCEFCGVANGAVGERMGIDHFRVAGKEDVDFLKFVCKRDKKTLSWAIQKAGLTKIVLTVAHLDHDPCNHAVSLERLRALCQSCHLAFDNPRHVANRKLTQHGKYAKGGGYEGVGKLF